MVAMGMDDLMVHLVPMVGMIALPMMRQVSVRMAMMLAIMRMQMRLILMMVMMAFME